MSYPDTLSELANYPKALSHAESGGGNVELKTIYFENPNSIEQTVQGAIVNGKYADVGLVAEATTAVQYIEPEEGDRSWELFVTGTWEFSTDYELPEQVDYDGQSLYIDAGLPDGTTLHLKSSGGDN